MADIITTAEVKTILNISGSSQDSLIAFHIESAQTLLYQILGVTDVLTQTITRELTKVYDEDHFYLKHFPVTSITGIYNPKTHVELTGYTFEIDSINTRLVRILDSSGLPYAIGYEDIKVTYVAGYADADNVPNALKMVVAYIIGGLIAENRKLGGVNKYRVGSKEVQFSDQQSAQRALSMIKPYLANYKNHVIVS